MDLSKALTTLHRNSVLDFLFWAAVLILCNLASVYLHALHGLIPKGDIDHVLIALTVGFFLQLPLLAAVLLFGAFLHLSLATIPRALYATVLAVFTVSVLSIFLAFYFTSEEMYQNFKLFLSPSAFSIVFTDTAQILRDAWHDASSRLILLGFATIVFAIARSMLGYVSVSRRRTPDGGAPDRSGRASLIVASAMAAATVLSLVALSTGNVSANARYNSFPTTFALSAEFEATVESMASKGPVPDRRLEDILSMEEYAKGAGTIESKPNVFLILLESVSSDHAGFAGYFRSDITPNIDALAHDSMVFVNAYAPSNHSNYAQTSIQSSQYPRRTRRLDFFRTIGYPKTTLFDVLGYYGYETAVMSSQNENWQGMERFLTHHSKIDFFFHSPSALGNNIGMEMKLDDAVTRKRAERYIRERKAGRPLFMYMNFQRTHFPYDLSESEHPVRPYRPDEIDFRYTFFSYPVDKVDIVRNRYDNALHYVDHQVGQFIRFLKDQGLYEDAIIVLAPDHGEAFYEHGYPTHGTSLFDDQLKTFMLIKAPGQKVKGREEGAVSLIDIPPTVLGLLGLRPHPNFQGYDVLGGVPGKRRIYATAQGAIPADGVIDYPWKFIYSAKEGKVLLNVAMDPEERFDLSGQFPGRRKELDEALREYVRAQTRYYESPRIASKYPPKY